MGPRIGAPAEHHGFMLGAAAGILFGVSDIAIKAISGHGRRPRRARPAQPLDRSSPSLASVAAFYASAKGLQDGEAVPVIAVTGTAANVAGIVGGIIVFGDPLSGHPLMLAGRVPRLRAGPVRRLARPRRRCAPPGPPVPARRRRRAALAV